MVDPASFIARDAAPLSDWLAAIARLEFSL
jgi:hypothetical protein